MSGFWEHAFEDVGDNLSLLNAVAGDVQANLNPFSDSFMSGDAPTTAEEAERQNAAREGRDYSQARADASGTGGLYTVGTAVEATGKDVGHALGETVGKGLDFLSGWGGVALLVGGAVVVLAGPQLVAALVRR